MHTHRKPSTTQTSIDRALNTLLERPMWPRQVAARKSYVRRHDDSDGERGQEQEISVYIAQDTDAWVRIGDRTLRFREAFGGGLSPRTRNALLVLAEAIRRDNEEFPQDRRDEGPQA